MQTSEWLLEVHLGLLGHSSIPRAHICTLRQGYFVTLGVATFNNACAWRVNRRDGSFGSRIWPLKQHWQKKSGYQCKWRKRITFEGWFNVSVTIAPGSGFQLMYFGSCADIPEAKRSTWQGPRICMIRWKIVGLIFTPSCLVPSITPDLRPCSERLGDAWL